MIENRAESTDKLTPFQRERRIILRSILDVFGSAVALSFLTACADAPGPTVRTADSSPFLPVPPKDILTPFPAVEYISGNYSETVKRFNLMPLRFTEKDSGEVRVKAAVEYLKKVREVLKSQKDNPNINPRLDHYKLADKQYIGDNAIFPIAITPGASLVDALDIFFDHDFEKKTRVVFNPPKERPHAESETRKFVFDVNTQSWKREETVISFNNDIMNRGNFIEPDNNSYLFRTDLDMALNLFYEYTHALREDAILTILQNENQLPRTITSGEVASRVQVKNIALQKKYSRQYGLGDNYRPNIAQGNAFQCLLLYSLEQINSGYMPGARVLDPHPSFVAEQRRRDPSFTNLYERFKRTVLLDFQNGVANTDWLKEAGSPSR